MVDRNLKLAFIGCGGIASRHIVAMKDLQERGRERILHHRSLRHQ